MKENNILKTLRKSENMSQYDIANIIHRSQGSYSDIENGKTEPDIETLVILADHFHCSIDYLIGRENEDSTILVQGESLSNDEKRVINEYRRLPVNKKQAILTLINSLDD